MKKKHRSLIILVFVIIMISVLTGCGEVRKAEKIVNETFTALKSLDFERAQEYVDVDDLVDNDSEDINDKIIMNNIFGKMEHEIIESKKIDKNTVNVKTKVTAVDMKPVLSEYLATAIQYAFINAFSNSGPSQEEVNKKMEEVLVECLNKPDLGLVTNEIIVKVSKEDGKWKINIEEALADALFGGLLSAAQELSD